MGKGKVQAQDAPPAVAPAGVTPTVTVKDGDMGGRYFGKAPDPEHTRHYYIAAEPTLWDFAPEVNDTICGKPMPP